MKAVVTAQEMAFLDNMTVEESGIPGLILMENAGRGIAEIVFKKLGDPADKCIHIFCGPGNNGGDGYVVARWLINHRAKVSVFLLADPEKITGDALAHLQILRALGHEPFRIKSAADLPSEKSDVIVDAMLGTGVQGRLKELYACVVEHINAQKALIIAVDIPTGVNADNGAVIGEAVRADVTATLALLKRGLLFTPGREYCGKVKIVDISMPLVLIEKNHPQVYWVEAEDVRPLLPKRSPNAHKNQCGQVALVAGSRGFTGAAALAGEASLRAGAGLSYLLIPADLTAVMEAKLTEVITVPMPDNDGYLSISSLPLILEQVEHKTAVALGPGLGRQPVACELVRQLLQTLAKPLVLDADGLNACVGQTHLFREYNGELILTPHVGELSRLIGLSTSEIASDCIQIAKKYAVEWQCTLVLKGGPTVTACADGRVCVNSTGNAGMATAGTGDVLAGIIVGLLAQGLSTTDAAVAGVYVHGLAGNLAKKRCGELGMIAGDVLRQLPYALRRLAKEKQ